MFLLKLKIIDKKILKFEFDIVTQYQALVPRIPKHQDVIQAMVGDIAIPIKKLKS